jgi:hypothetical protein
MRVVLCLLVALAALTSASFVHSMAAVPSNIPSDFSANISINQGGQKLSGYLVWHYSARRTFQYIKEFDQVTYHFQSPGRTQVYSYTITTSGCTCTILRSQEIQEYWVQAHSATPNGTCPQGGTGNYFVNDAYPTLKGAAQDGFCFNGDTPSAMIDEMGNRMTVFSNFKKTVAPTDFPEEPMRSNIANCASGCI